MRIFCVQIYSKLQSFIRLSLTVIKLCYIKRDHLENFTFHLKAHCTNSVAKYEWPPNSPDLNSHDYYVWGAMLQAFHKLNPKPKTIPLLKSALQ